MVQWWDSAKIEATVTRQFVCRHLLPQEIERLDQSLGFGDGLTDGTYWEWINTKAKRIFLILVDLNIPDQIFGIIDDSWDDHDLPIAEDQVERLALTAVRDDRMDRKFFLRQFHYTMKLLQKGEHIVYLDHDIVPIDSADRRSSLLGSHSIDKVALPNWPGRVFCRRRIPLSHTNSPGGLTSADFQEAISSIKGIQHHHLVCYFASYIHQGVGFVLFTPAMDSSLKSFLGSAPSSFRNLPKKERRHLVMNWILCLVDALAYIHSRRYSHGNIKPSTIHLTNQLHISFSDFTRMSTDALTGQPEKSSSSFDRESYDYAAPEQWFRPTTGPSGYTAGNRKSKGAQGAMSTSPENRTSFSIPRNDNPSSPSAMLQSPNPQLDAQAADVFSLGCVLLEMAGFLLKKSTKSFATHRASKNKKAGRGGAVPDSSFHKNLGQVETWMSTLAKEATKKASDADGATVFRGVVPILHVVARMLSANPDDRPTADEVQLRVYQVITHYCGLKEPHCVHRYGGGGGWDYGVGQLRIQSPTPMDPTTVMVSRRSTTSSRPTQGSGSGSSGSSGSSSRSRPGQQVAGPAHSRTDSSGGMSNNDHDSNSDDIRSSISSGKDAERDRGSSAGSVSVSISDWDLAALRNIPVTKTRLSGTWQTSSAAVHPQTLYPERGDQAPV
ncbi:hypothetical protein SODALDRAFT_355501 [Sodiomyces alkalinus F11]|uniref:non-specific serine/threonine protein kinase n=1 Tax=Sodiomyces alkalinus (strain CBS 110278 / VKM F-3762 / F11) TaxID=1314773 RepID=A0A3N2Q948_SODAK|nr:hypothetical protein SODALDRAFT_355501 [Sodiomyces alkalinus F11]ROT43293.1 hypothetical protein SODALDRAFT_355501 [Sodiomyces alkalinus F11]